MITSENRWFTGNWWTRGSHTDSVVKIYFFWRLALFWYKKKYLAPVSFVRSGKINIRFMTGQEWHTRTAWKTFVYIWMLLRLGMWLYLLWKYRSPRLVGMQKKNTCFVLKCKEERCPRELGKCALKILLLKLFCLLDASLKCCIHRSTQMFGRSRFIMFKYCKIIYNFIQTLYLYFQ